MEIQTGAPHGANATEQRASPESETNPTLDLSHVAPPDDLESARFEDLTIDGICGVY